MMYEVLLFLFRDHCCCTPPSKKSPNSGPASFTHWNLVVEVCLQPIKPTCHCGITHIGLGNRETSIEKPDKKCNWGSIWASFAKSMAYLPYSWCVCPTGNQCQDHAAPSSSTEPNASLTAYSLQLPADLLWVATCMPDELICSSCSYIFYLPCYLIDPGCAWSCKEALPDLATYAIYPVCTPVSWQGT